MPAKILLFHDEGRKKMCAGLNTLADAVKVTLGLNQAHGAAKFIDCVHPHELPDAIAIT